MRLGLIFVAVFSVLLVGATEARADSIISYTSPSDFDGDGVHDLIDNAVAVSNPAQEDADNDGIGDAADPDPYDVAGVTTTLDLGGPYSINVGDDLTITFSVTDDSATGYGILLFDLDNDAQWDDGYHVGPMLAGTDYFVTIASDYLSVGSWDLETAGTYTISAIFGNAAMQGSYVSATVNVSAVPEPGSIALLGLGLVGLGFASRRGRAEAS